MMRRMTRLILASALVLAVVSIAAAQQVPQPVTRMGDWVEVGNEVFMNIIATNDWRYQTTHNYDFENDIQDRTASRSPQATVTHQGSGDFLFGEIRFGVDMRYQKNLRMRVLLENQMVFDGNRIDNGFSNTGDAPATQEFADGRNLSCNDSGNCVNRNTWNLERAWIDYSFPGTPLRMRVGADLWFTDPAGVIGDDDPRIALYADLGPKKQVQLYAAAVIQTESLRLGLTNDNDDIYYNFGAQYKTQALVFALDLTYFRFRWQGAQGRAFAGQKIDSVLIRPSVTGNLGLVSFLLQPMVVAGNADSSTATGNVGHNILGWSVVAQAEVNLGPVRPFLAFLFGSGDDKPADSDLRSFSPLPQREISLMTATRYFGVFTNSPSMGVRDYFPPAAVNIGSGFEFLHTVSNPFSDRVGNTLTPGLTSTYNNPGLLVIAPGVKFFPVKGHELDFFYIYRAVIETAPIEAELLANGYGPVSVSKSMTNELALMWTWTLNPHFDIRAFGAIAIPGSGAKDIASAQDCDFNTAGLQPCGGSDPALFGELRFRGRF
jgi:hypothetical protein